ncbi:ATP-dependent RNA helicase DHX8 [Gryllus bimaculatus]|nr:ATP-dependent RNA helicase DHX8 [Gryllus bimaculatus]
MGKHKKGFNWKSRQVVETTIDDSKSKKLVVDIQGLRSDTYDDCNALVIPSEKRKTKKKVQNDVPQKILSKKQRKRLQQIVDRKNKKETRASLLNALAEVQAPPEVLKKLVSITKYQTKGLKRIHEEEICTAEENTSGENVMTNKLVGHRKRRMLLNEDTNEQATKDPNIVGFESSSSSDDETSEEEEEEKDGNEENHLVCEDHMRNTEMGTGKSKENALEEKCGCESEISHTVEREVIAVDKNSEQLPQVAIGGPKITAPNVPAVFVPVNRPPGVQEARMKLPVLAEEQAIMEAINENDVVVLAGQQEVRALVRNLRKAFPYRRMEIGSEKEESNSVKLEESESEDDFPHKKNPKVKKSNEIHLPIIDLDEYPVVSSGDVDEDELALSDDNEDMEEEIDDPKATRAPMWVLPLYSLLPGHKQAKVFEPPPPGSRLCVVATNVAETSLTIPSVRYVVDCGKEKRRRYDKTTGVSAFMVTWTSKASANQRAGRAGRTGPGHCYRLYSSAMFNDQFEEYSIPEMQRKPVDDLVLQMKSMGIHRVINFPFPSPPGQEQLQASERRLILLGALQRREGSSEDDWTARITSLGQSMATFPVAPRFAKMLALSHQQDLLAYTICMVAALAVPEVLIDTAGNKETAAFRRMWAGTGNSLLLGDPMVLMRAVGAAEHAGTTGGLASFCEKHALRLKAVVEVRKLRLQLTAEINSAIPDLDLVVDPQMPPPSDEQARLLRQLLLAGLGDQVARRVDPETIKDEEDKMKWKHAYRCGELEEPVRIHSTSVLRREYPEWVIYQEVYEVEGQRLFMRGVTAIEPEWLPSLAPALCHLSLPLPEYTPTYDSSTDSIQCHITGTYGRAAWNLPIVQIEYPSGLERYKWFAVFFLNGSVCPKLASYTSELLSTPASITKVWANLQPRTEIFLKTLMAYQVDTKAKLLEQWKQDATYLLEPYKKWLPESAHNDVINIWPPL